MSFTHTLGVTYKTDAGTIASTSDVYTGDSENDIEDTVAGSVTDKEFDIHITPDTVKSMVLYSDQALVIKTNDKDNPQDNIALTAKKQLVWNTDLGSAGVPNPFSNTVTKVFATNSGSTLATLKLRVLSNAVPPPPPPPGP